MTGSALYRRAGVLGKKIVNYNMEKRKLNKSKLSGKLPPDDSTTAFTVMIEVSEPDYVPDWLNIRHRITHTIFTAEIRKADFSKLETDKLVVSFSINEQLDSI